MDSSACLVKHNVGVELANLSVFARILTFPALRSWGMLTWRPDDQSGSFLAFWRSGRGYPAALPSQSRQACTFVPHDNVFEVGHRYSAHSHVEGQQANHRLRRVCVSKTQLT